MKKQFAMSLALLLLGASSLKAAPVEGRETGNGGDAVALEFQVSAQEAIQDISKNQARYPKAQAGELMRAFVGASILVTDKPLFVKKGDVTQESAAVNFHGPDTILINRDRWREIKTVQVRRALALHEILGLLGVESTGDYSVSQVYLNDIGIKCNVGLCAEFNSEKKFATVWYKEWLVSWNSIWDPKFCDRGEILDLKDTAEREALDKCRESGMRNCKINGATVLYNGKIEDERACVLRGRPKNCAGGIIAASSWYGGIVRGSSTGSN